MIYGIIGFLLGFLVGGYIFSTFVLWVINNVVVYHWLSQGMHIEAAERHTADVLDFSRMRWMPAVWTWNSWRRELREKHEAYKATKGEG